MPLASSFTVIDDEHASLISVEHCKEVDAATVEVSIDDSAVRMNREQLLETARLLERIAEKLTPGVK